MSMSKPVFDSKLGMQLSHHHADLWAAMTPFIHFKGYYSTDTELPTNASAGDFAVVGSTNTMWVYDGDISDWKDTSASAGVLSFNSRVGVVTPQFGDYSFSMIAGNLDASQLPTGGMWTVGAGQTVVVAGADGLSRFSILCPILMPTATSPSVVTISDPGTGEKMLIPVANLPIDLMPTGGIWSLTSDLNISGGNVVFNYGYEDRDFTIRKLTSGDAYKYDAGTNTHTWYGNTMNLAWNANSGVFGVFNSSSNQYTQIGNQGISIVDGVNGLHGGFGAQMFSFSNSSINLWAGLYGNEFIFNVLAQDIDFTIKKLISGEALKYDAGLDTFTFGSGALFPEITLVNSVSEFSTDGTLSDNSDLAVPTEKAVKTYVDNKLTPPLRNQTVYIDAGAMIPCTTNGAASGTKEYASDKPEVDYFAFDGATKERVQFKFVFPNNWDGGTITAKFYWSSATGSTAGDTCEWGIKAVCINDDDAMAATFGTAQTVSDTLLADNGADMQVSSSTSAITIGGTPTAGSLVCFEVFRNTDGADDMAEDAWLFGVEITYGAE